jgi:hypothetical protein
MLAFGAGDSGSNPLGAKFPPASYSSPAVLSRKPAVIRCMVDNLENGDIAFCSLVGHGVDHSPECRKIFDEQILRPVMVRKEFWNLSLPNHFAVQTIRPQDGR